MGVGVVCGPPVSLIRKGKPGGNSRPVTVQEGRVQAGVPLLKDGVAGLGRESDPKNLPWDSQEGIQSPSFRLLSFHVFHGNVPNGWRRG